MRSLFVTIGLFLTACSAFAYKPAVEREFDEVASRGCNNRDGDFIVRAMVSNANEDTVVLSDPLDIRFLHVAGQRPARTRQGRVHQGQVRSERGTS
jgi:hypothetical protein